MRALFAGPAHCGVSPRMLTAVLLGAVLLLGACGDPIGTACEITGSGFQASHNCRVKCLQHRAIQCPGGDEIRPRVCSGRSACEPGSCPDGQLCYSIADAFNEESYCVAQDICGAPLDEAAGAAWEEASAARAKALRDEWARKRARRDNAATTAPAPVDTP